jgi:hypothetical protein
VDFSPFAVPVLANPFSQSTQNIIRAPGNRHYDRDGVCQRTKE